MINSNALMFSRTESKDYRWLYRDNNLIGDDLYHILSDYEEFETYKEQYLNGRYMIVRRLCNGAAIYGFSKLDKTDQYSRNIYALIGFTFLDLNGDIFTALVQYMSSYLYYMNISVTFPLSATDATEDCEKKCAISIDEAIENYRNSEKIRTLAKAIEAFTERNQWEAFIIKGEYAIEPVLTPKKVPQPDIYSVIPDKTVSNPEIQDRKLSFWERVFGK